PSVFSLLPTLIERAGVGRRGFGAITAVYTVLAENDDASDPVVDIARASLDGQVMLSRSLADATHYPAIDLNGSISRVMQNLVDPPALKAANRLRRLWSLYQQNSDLIQVGAYQPGTSADLDAAITLRPEIEQFLQQDMHDPCGLDETRQALLALYQKSLQLSGANVEVASAKPATPASFGQPAARQGNVTGRGPSSAGPASNNSRHAGAPAPGMRIQARGGKA
ncbi:MAG: hypothetical protein ACO3S3_12500, partial [Pseudohongiellaceae bacterium]